MPRMNIQPRTVADAAQRENNAFVYERLGNLQDAVDRINSSLRALAGSSMALSLGTGRMPYARTPSVLDDTEARYDAVLGTFGFGVAAGTERVTVSGTVLATDLSATSGTAGYMPYFDASKILKITGLYYDVVNGRYGIGTGATVPSQLTVQSDGINIPNNALGIALDNTRTSYINPAAGIYSQTSPLIRWRSGLWSGEGDTNYRRIDFRMFAGVLSAGPQGPTHGFYLQSDFNSSGTYSTNLFIRPARSSAPYYTLYDVMGIFNNSPDGILDTRDNSTTYVNPHFLLSNAAAAHSLSGVLPVKSYFGILQQSWGSGGGAGGVWIKGIEAYGSNPGLKLSGILDSTSTGTNPGLALSGYKSDGAGGGAAFAAGEVVLAVDNYTTRVITVTGDGNLHVLSTDGAEGNTGVGALDVRGSINALKTIHTAQNLTVGTIVVNPDTAIVVNGYRNGIDVYRTGTYSNNGIQIRSPSAVTAGYDSFGLRIYDHDDPGSGGLGYAIYTNSGRIRFGGSLTVVGGFGCNGAAAQTAAAHIADPSGGATVDAEARTAINAILAVIENNGQVATS